MLEDLLIKEPNRKDVGVQVDEFGDLEIKNLVDDDDPLVTMKSEEDSQYEIADTKTVEFEVKSDAEVPGADDVEKLTPPPPLAPPKSKIIVLPDKPRRRPRMKKNLDGVPRPAKKTKSSDILQHYPCTLCDKFYLAKGSLKAHMIVAHAEPEHVCDFCSAKFPRISRLRDHLNVYHFDLKPFQCDYCGKDFRSKMNLKKHVVWHTGKSWPRLGCNEFYSLASKF